MKPKQRASRPVVNPAEKITFKIKGCKIMASTGPKASKVRFTCASRPDAWGDEWGLGEDKPTLLISERNGDFFAVLFLDDEEAIEGMWRGDALPWILEAFKPLANAGIIKVRCFNRKCETRWRQTKTAREINAAWGAKDA